MTTTTRTEAHFLDCWMNALLDTAENLEGTEWDTREQIIDIAYDSKVSGLSTCTCADHADYPSYAGVGKTSIDFAADYYL